MENTMETKPTGWIELELSRGHRLMQVSNIRYIDFHENGMWADIFYAGGCNSEMLQLTNKMKDQFRREGIRIPNESIKEPFKETPKPNEWVLAIDINNDGRIYVGGEAITGYLTRYRANLDKLRAKCDRVLYVEYLNFKFLSGLKVLREEIP